MNFNWLRNPFKEDNSEDNYDNSFLDDTAHWAKFNKYINQYPFVTIERKNNAA